MTRPVRIFIDRQELLGWTSMRLRRAKEEMTGELTIEVFMGWLPDAPVVPQATTGREVLVYVGNHLAFTGTLDRRRDATESTDGSTTGTTSDLNIGPDSYRVSFTCRGKTKFLIDSSQQHPTGTMLRPTNRSVFETLMEPWSIELEWTAAPVDLDKVRFRDGSAVSDELQRIAQQCSLFMYETRDGRLRVEDPVAGERRGEPLVLGTNIVQFQTDQAIDQERSIVTVKGQRIESNAWGAPAVIPTIQNIANELVESFTPWTVRLYGNATEELLQRRAQYEANRRSAEAKQIKLQVFYIQQTSGDFWDIGTLHYVEIPTAGIYGDFEVVELEYLVEGNSVGTTLTLSPPPAPLATGAPSSREFLAEVPEPSDTPASARASGNDDEEWQGPRLRVVNRDPNDIKTGPGFLTDADRQAARPPLLLPATATDTTGIQI